jgi:multiple sugar transport system substrate-binding protein
VAALEYFASLVEEGAIPVGSDVFDFRALFAQSKLGFYLDAPLRGTLRQMSGQEGTDFDNQIGPATMPVGISGEPESSVWGHWLAVLNTSEHKEEAALFIEYLTTDPEIVKMYGEEGAIPGIQSLLEDEMFQDPYVQTYLTGLETARSIPAAMKNSGNFLQGLDALSIALADVVLNGADPQEALDSVALTLTVVYPGTTIVEE